MATKITKKKSTILRTTRIRKASQLILQMEAVKQQVADLLLSYVPDSIPSGFRVHLIIILSKLIADKSFIYHYYPKDYGFADDKHFEKQIKLLQKAWKGIVRMSSLDSEKIPLPGDIPPYCIEYNLV